MLSKSLLVESTMRALLFSLMIATVATADVKETSFGKLPDGREVKLFTLTAEGGITAKIMSYGAILTELHVPDKAGKTVDVVLGFDTLEGYLKGHPYFGANVGRCANRIANAEFTLEGTKYKLAANNGKHSLHGGKEGFDKKLWVGKIDPYVPNCVRFTYTSPDGEEGYPGTLKVEITYLLRFKKSLEIITTATTDKATPCNIAHHSYLNLAGHNSGDILGHNLRLSAKHYTPADETLIPTGVIAPVAGTPYDFSGEGNTIGKRIKEIKADPVGYDVNYAFNVDDKIPPFAVVVDQRSRRSMSMSFDGVKGLQFYSGNFLDGKTVGKGGAAYKQYGAFCLEPQFFPDSVNKIGTPGWDDRIILKPGGKYQTRLMLTFTMD
jgi:aldose 1-epimerase